MRYAIVFSACVAGASAHGFLYTFNGANGVVMPCLSVTDGTPRNCVLNACGAQADTSIIRDLDMVSGAAGPLGKTQGHGNVDAETNIAAFFNQSAVPTNQGASGSVGVEDNIPGGLNRAQRRQVHKRQLGNMLRNMANLPVIGVAGVGGNRVTYPYETMIKDTAGQGAMSGLPTSQADGTLEMVYTQVNQDGAGPLTCAYDATSGGKDPNAFKDCPVTQNMPGLGISGLSVATNTQYTVKCKLPQGVTCSAEVAGVKNVCIVRCRNQAFAGPFGGSCAFTVPQNPPARKRAIAYSPEKRFEIGSEQ